MTVIYIGRLVKLFWMVSLLAFLAVLLYVHVSLPPFLSFPSELTSFNFVSFDKNKLFYSALGIFIISNLAWYLLIKVFARMLENKNLKNRKFFTLNRVSWLINWLNGFSGLINVVIILTLWFLSILFSETQTRLDKMVTVIYGFLFLIGIWFLLLAYLVLRKENQEVLEDN
jgi:hypothetical protein